MMKTCIDCKVEKLDSEFYPEPRVPDKLSGCCKECGRLKSITWRNKNIQKARESAQHWRKTCPEKYKADYTRKNIQKAGVTVEEYSEMLRAQGGVCAICEKECSSGFRLAVDHIHGTNPRIIRGLLCAACNRALGGFKDSPGLLLKAAAYVCKGKEKQEAA